MSTDQYICKKTNRVFKTKQALLNHFRKAYDSYNMEEIYLAENNVDKSDVCKCKLCGKETKFLSFFKGYADACDTKCHFQYRKRTNTFRNSIDVEYDKFVNDNIDFYITNFDKKKVVDPFLKEEVLGFGRMLQCRVHPKTIEKIKTYTDTCSVCGKDFKQWRFKKKKITCGRRGCRNRVHQVRPKHSNRINGIYQRLLKYYEDEGKLFRKLERKYTNTDEIFRYKNTDNVVFRQIENFLFPICIGRGRKNSENVQKLSIMLGKNKMDVVYDYFPEMLRKCDTCGEYISWINWGILPSTVTTTNTKFCSYGCQGSNEKLRHHQSNQLKEKIENGEFTPCVTNRWARSRIQIDQCDFPFRSSWDAMFWLLNQNTLYEVVRVPYIDSDGVKRVYITDFLDEERRIVYEIKPKSLIDDENNVLKARYAEEYCDEHGYSYKIISDDYFIDHINELERHKNIDTRIDSNIIVFKKEELKKYENQKN